MGGGHKQLRRGEMNLPLQSPDSDTCGSPPACGVTQLLQIHWRHVEGLGSAAWICFLCASRMPFSTWPGVRNLRGLPLIPHSVGSVGIPRKSSRTRSKSQAAYYGRTNGNGKLHMRRLPGLPSAGSGPRGPKHRRIFCTLVTYPC